MDVSLRDMSVSVFRYICVQECAHLCGGQRTNSGITTQDIFLWDLFACLFVWLVGWLVYFLRKDLYSHC